MKINPPPRVAREMIMAGYGHNLADAKEALREEKRSLVPAAKVTLPECLTPEIIDAEIDRRLTCLLWDVAEVKSVILQAGDILPRPYRQSALMSLYELWCVGDDLYQSLHDLEELGAAGGTLVGILLRKRRLGELGDDVKLRLVDLPKEEST